MPSSSPTFVELRTGVTLQYVEHGAPSASAVPVVLLHGIGDSWRSFELVLNRLDPSIRAFAISQRGHGDSSRPDAAYHYRDFASDVAAFLNALGLGPAVVLGHSMGSAVAQRFAIDHPRLTRGLVLTASFYELARSPAAQELWRTVSTMSDPVDPEFVREFQRSTTAAPVPHGFLENVVMKEPMKLPARVWREVVRCNLEDDLAAELVEIDAPTLLVWGDRDALVTRRDVEAQRSAIAGSELVVYEGCGHAIPWEAPDRLASELARFVASVQPESQGAFATTHR